MSVIQTYFNIYVVFRECVLPIYPPKGKWSIIGGPDTNPGSKVPLNTIITFSCDKKYKLSSDYSVITCLGGDWDLPPPQCLCEYYLFK